MKSISRENVDKMILVDTGASDLFLKNLERLGIDVKEMDYAQVLLHFFGDKDTRITKNLHRILGEKSMILTILLSVGMMLLLFLAILSATLTLPSKALIKNFPKDVQEKLSPRLDNLPMSGKRILGIVILILIVIAMLGLVVWSGIDGIRHDYNFGNFLTRFLIIFAVLKAFDIIALDYFLLTKSSFFQHYFPETKDCTGWKDFGFNRRQQIRHCIAIPIYCSALAGIFTLIG